MDGWVDGVVDSLLAALFRILQLQLCVVRLNKYDYIVRHYTIMIAVMMIIVTIMRRF